MQDNKIIGEDHARSTIPAAERISGLRIGLILIGMVITVPAFLSAAQIGQALGLDAAILAFAAAGFLVAALAALTGYVGAEVGLSTAMLLQFAFGRSGAKLVNFILVTATLGWFGVTADLFGHAMQQSALAAGFPVLAGIGATTFMLGGVVVMVATTIFGFKALDRIALVAVPFMFAFLAVTAWLAQALPPGTRHTASHMGLGLAISALAGGLMVAVVIMPDLCRFATNGKQAMLAACLAFAIGWPLVQLLAAMPSVATGKADLTATFVMLGIGAPGLLMIVLATWTTNANNLYSASLVLATLAPRWTKWQLAIAGGVVGAVIALSGAGQHLIPLLLLLGGCIPPIAGIYMADYFLIRRQRYVLSELDNLPAVNWAALAAWAIAAAAGLAGSFYGLSLSGIPALDAIALAFVAYAPLSWRSVQWA